MNAFEYNAQTTRMINTLLVDSLELVAREGVYKSVKGLDVSKYVITLSDGSRYKLILEEI